MAIGRNRDTMEHGGIYLKLIKKGAEAYLYKDTWFGRDVIKKVRISKKYRDPKLDIKIRSSRTITEAKIISEARKKGVKTPYVYEIDVKNHTIVMEFLDGPRIKEILDLKKVELFIEIGKQVGLLHQNNLIHGDLTTSNMILLNDKDVFFIDFGLAAFSTSIESFGVDIHLMKRALNSTHPKLAERCYELFQEGYKNQFPKKYDEIKSKIIEIESRGRYIDRKEDN